MTTYEFPPGSPEAARLEAARREVDEAHDLARDLERRAREARRAVSQAQHRYDTLLLELGGQERLPFEETP